MKKKRYFTSYYNEFILCHGGNVSCFLTSSHKFLSDDQVVLHVVRKLGYMKKEIIVPLCV